MSKSHRHNFSAQKRHGGEGRYRLLAIDGHTHKCWLDQATRDACMRAGEIEPAGGNDYRMKRKAIPVSTPRGGQSKDIEALPEYEVPPSSIDDDECEANAGIGTIWQIKLAKPKVELFAYRSWAQGICTIYMTREQIAGLDSYSA